MWEGKHADAGGGGGSSSPKAPPAALCASRGQEALCVMESAAPTDARFSSCSFRETGSRRGNTLMFIVSQSEGPGEVTGREVQRASDWG